MTNWRLLPFPVCVVDAQKPSTMAANNFPPLYHLLLTIGTTASLARGFINNVRSDFDGLLTYAKQDPFVGIVDTFELDSDTAQEVFFLIAWMHLHSVTDFAHVDTRAYMAERNNKSRVSEDLLRWYEKTIVPTLPDRRDVVPANTTFTLNWRLGVHDLPSLVENIDLIKSIVSPSISWLQLAEIEFCAAGLKQHGEENGQEYLSSHNPRDTVSSNTTNFFRRLGLNGDEIETVKEEMISLDYLNLVKYQQDFLADTSFEGVMKHKRICVYGAIQIMERQEGTGYSCRIQQYQLPSGI